MNGGEAFADSPLNIVLHALPNTATTDELYAFKGLRARDATDLPLVESSIDSLEFSGVGDGIGSSIVHVGGLTGLDAGQQDQIGVWITSETLGLQVAPMLLAETGQDTGVFRPLFSGIPPGYSVEYDVDEVTCPEQGLQPIVVPFLVRVDLPAGMPTPDAVSLNGREFGLKEVDGVKYFDEVFVACKRELRVTADNLLDRPEGIVAEMLGAELDDPLYSVPTITVKTNRVLYPGAGSSGGNQGGKITTLRISMDSAMRPDTIAELRARATFKGIFDGTAKPVHKDEQSVTASQKRVKPGRAIAEGGEVRVCRSGSDDLLNRSAGPPGGV